MFNLFKIPVFMDKATKIKLLSKIILIGFLIAVCACFIRSFCFNLEYPYNTFLFSNSRLFSDFFEVLAILKDFAPYSTSGNYTSFAYLIFVPILLFKNKFLLFLILCGIFLIFFIYMNAKNLYCENFNKFQNILNISIFSFLSYPFLFLMNRANSDALLLMIFCGFIYLFKKEKYILSAVVLSLLCATKPFFVVFLALFFPIKKYKEIFLASFLTVMLFLGSFLAFHGDYLVQLVKYFTNLQYTSYLYTYEPLWGSHSTSLYLSLKFILIHFFHLDVGYLAKLAVFYKIFTVLASILTFIAIYREKIFWKQIMFLIIYMCLVPILSYDYRLIFLFVPLWLWLNTLTRSKFDLSYIILFGLLLIPKEYFIMDLDGFNTLSLSTLISPLILIIFFGLMFFEQSRQKNTKP